MLSTEDLSKDMANVTLHFHKAIVNFFKDESLEWLSLSAFNFLQEVRNRNVFIGAVLEEPNLLLEPEDGLHTQQTGEINYSNRIVEALQNNNGLHLMMSSYTSFHTDSQVNNLGVAVTTVDYHAGVYRMIQSYPDKKSDKRFAWNDLMALAAAGSMESALETNMVKKTFVFFTFDAFQNVLRENLYGD